MPTSYRALADHSNVPRSTLHYRARERRSKEEKAQDQRYLKPYEEDVVVQFLVQMSDLGQPIRIKFVPSIAFSVTRPTASSRDQPASLHNKTDEILGRDKQPESAAAPAQHQGRDSAFQQEGDAVGAQGAVREDSLDEPG
jgi:hypothetical protein